MIYASFDELYMADRSDTAIRLPISRYLSSTIFSLHTNLSFSEGLFDDESQDLVAGEKRRSENARGFFAQRDSRARDDLSLSRGRFSTFRLSKYKHNRV